MTAEQCWEYVTVGVAVGGGLRRVACGPADVTSLIADMRSRIAESKANVGARDDWLRRTKPRLTAHFERIDAHLSRVHGYLAEHLDGLSWDGPSASLRDGFVRS